MAKYSKGETSPEVKRLSDGITNSIKEKTRLIKAVTDFTTVPDYIPMDKKKCKIKLGDVNAWESKELGISKYSYNTANTDKNREHLNKLKNVILDFNQKISEKKNEVALQIASPKSTYRTRAELEAENKELKKEIANLDRSVVEIFRAYNQLKSFISTHNYENKQYHEILRLQTQTNNNKLKNIK